MPRPGPRQIPVTFRVPPGVREQALARCERERINLTDVLRGFLTAWADEEHDDT